MTDYVRLHVLLSELLRLGFALLNKLLDLIRGQGRKGLLEPTIRRWVSWLIEICVRVVSDEASVFRRDRHLRWRSICTLHFYHAVQ